VAKKIKIFFGTGFYSGYFPKIPGTFGSLIAMLFFFIPGFGKLSFLIPFIILVFFLGIYLGSEFEKIYAKDPPVFTLDEFIGTWITFLFVEKSLMILITGFIVWRILDILKPYPANKAEKLKGGLGIMLDDVISGMYSLIFIYIFKLIIY